MLYSFVKIIARLAIPIYCRKIVCEKKDILKSNDGPILLASNHPNSFLDAIILCTLFNKPLYSLARGDAFKNKIAAGFLTNFHMFPVYRVSEGVENMEENYKTFDLCKDIFMRNGNVLIFSEGRCINEWHLRPLKKGTARLAISSWQSGINLKVLPVAINYSSFNKFGKNIFLSFGTPINKEDINYNDTHGNAIRQFNDTLQMALSKDIFEIEKNDTKAIYNTFYIKQPLYKKILLAIPAFIGYLVHAPLYLFIKWLSKKLVKEDGHADSIIIGLLFILYPVFLIAVTTVILIITHKTISLALLLALPFTAWSYVQLKKQLD